MRNSQLFTSYSLNDDGADFDPSSAKDALQIIQDNSPAVFGASSGNPFGSGTNLDTVKIIVQDAKAPSTTSGKVGPRLAAHLDAMTKIREPTEEWLKTKNIHIARNGGGGDKASCLIISLLQAVTGKYDDQNFAGDVAPLRGALQTEFGDDAMGQLGVDDPVFQKLFEEIKKNQNGGKDLTVHLVQPSADGPVHVGKIGDDESKDGTSVVLFQSAGHFEALTMRAKA